MLFQLKSYIKFLVKSTHIHGVHSPFIYGLITQCFNDKSQKQWHIQFEKYRNSLIKDTTSITVNDFGAGSKSLKKNKRKVSEIASKAGISLKKGKLLGGIVNYFKPAKILEIGTSVGIASASMSLANSKTNITTLEGCINTAEIAKNYFEKFQLNNIRIITGNFSETLATTLENEKFDFIYFDGNHQKEATIAYFNQCLKYAHNDTVFIFDDIYWSKGMKEAWKYIMRHPKVTITVDNYHWGMVFFRKEQEKQHFFIRV